MSDAERDENGVNHAAAMLSVLDLAESEARTTEDIFTGISHPMPTGRVYGGQVLAQSIVAASRTVGPDRSLHSMHGYFLRPGADSDGLTFAVDRIHDGRSFSTRRAQAYQHGLPIFSMIASFQDDDPGLEHQQPMPEGIPAPEELQTATFSLDSLRDPSKRMFQDRPIELRHVQPPVYLTPSEDRTPAQCVWMRVRATLPDDAVLHRAALAYMSDMSIQEPILRAHGVTWMTPGLRVASLDHAMWWHRDARADEWLLYVQESPNARGGRGLSHGRIYTRDGVLVASVAQEVMVRIPEASAD